MDWPERILINKPSGITSFDVIRCLRRKYSATHAGAKAPKLGHAGTLDPLATGLMLIGVGAGTKKLHEYIKLDKEYVAEILVGEQRTTGDMEGEIIAQKEVVEAEEILRGKISSALTDMIGTLTLPVSAYSAIKIDGVPMYKRARAAEKTGAPIREVPVRDMVVHEVALEDLCRSGGAVVATVRFKVASGTYIRSLGEELGRRIGYPATLKHLCRTKVGPFSLLDAGVWELSESDCFIKSKK